VSGSAERLEPFVTAVTTVLREMAGVEVAAKSARRPVGGDRPADLAAVVRLLAPVEGWMALCFEPATAVALARRVLAGAAAVPVGEMAPDCAGELANVVAGQVKALMFGTPHHFSISLPSVGSAGEVIPADEPHWVVDFVGEACEFRILVRLPGSGAAEAAGG
jgi:chemotaxis protein CheX